MRLILARKINNLESLRIYKDELKVLHTYNKKLSPSKINNPINYATLKAKAKI